MKIVNLYRFIADHPLNRSARLAAFSRFFRWQLANRLLRGPYIIPFVGQTSLIMERGMTGATGNWYCGLHEVDEMAFVLHGLRPTDLFVDIGANVGSYTILAAGAVGSDAFAIEPLPETYRKLRRNIVLNELTEKVQAHCCGLSSTTGELAFISSLDTMNRVALPNEKVGTTVVQVTTLDLLCSDRKPTIIKIDVEGHEQWVIDGGKAVLSSPELKAVLMETNHSGSKFGIADNELSTRVQSFGFSPYSYDPFLRAFDKPRLDAKNTIFLRDVAAMQATCRAAPRFTMVNGEI